MNYIIIGIIIVVALFEGLVEIINYRNRNASLPKNVENLYNQEEYQTSLKYTMANFKLGIVRSGIKTIVLVLLLFFGFFGWLEALINGWTSLELVQTPLFVFGFYLINLIINIPFKYYDTFVIEEKFGFNKTTKKIFVVDIIKSLILVVIIGGAVLTALNMVYIVFAQRIAIFIGAAFILIILFQLIVFLANGFIIRRFNKLTLLEEGSLKDKINTLSLKLGFKINRIFIMDASKRSTKLNAFFTGLGKTREVVLFDTLVEKMTEDEVVAVLAHELGHATHKDVLKILLRSSFMVAVYALVLGLLLTQAVFATSFGLSGVHFGFALILLTIVLSPIDVLFGIFLNYWSRKAEYKADAFAAKHTSNEVMASALKRLVTEVFTNLTPHPIYVLVHYSHPPISERLRALGF